MNRLLFGLGLTFLVLAVATLALGSVATSYTTADRPVTVDVGDESAAVGFEVERTASATENHSSTERIMVTNRGHDPMWVTAQTTAGDLTGSNGTVHTGQRHHIDVRTDCATGSESVTVDLTLTGSERSLERSLTIEPSCD